jgi:hypothetical protein
MIEMEKSSESKMFSAYGDNDKDKTFDAKIDAFRDEVKVSRVRMQ